MTRTTRLPRHVIENLLRARGLTNDDGTTRTAKITHCRTCHAIVIHGLDNDICGLPTTTDPHPLTPAGELQATLTGRATYRLHTAASGQRLELHRRDDLHMATPPSPDVHVVAWHDCDAAPLDHYPYPTPAADPAATTGGPDARIPF